MVLKEKEQTTIEDLRTQEQSCIEKYHRYGQQAKDPVLKDLFDRLEKEEQHHYDSLDQVLNGQVPQCNVNDRDGAEYQPKATYDTMTNSEDKKTTVSLQPIVSAPKRWYPASTIRMYSFLRIAISENSLPISR